ncbi:MAG TPA: polysaccharide deacetylase family protein [Anaerovoracaceae bacterium]|nr:polysaccharide deacetylase family protein [Anaerovoracaceae bacterium]
METGPVILYSREDVPRLRYIAGIILGDILGLSWEVITDKRRLGKHPVINYSSENIPIALKISPDSLLFEKRIVRREITINEWKGLPVFFQTPPDSDIPFDIFAASFFLITRYEEYLEFQPDEYGRFRASSSVSYKYGFLGIPVVEHWAKEMAIALLKKFRTLTFKRNEYKALFTIDADQPFAYLGKGFIRSMGGLFRDLKNNAVKVGDRYRIVAGREKDPFEVFDYIMDNIQECDTDVRFFFPVGDHSKYDKNPSWKNSEYRKLIHSIDDKYITGLHPSFTSAGNYSMINDEATRLKTILGKAIMLSRFHYIRLFIPQSYRDIHNAGILEDYSMGYPDEPGFRAGIARPFYFYDVSEDQQTGLKIIPFQVMDGTLYKYKNLDPVASKEVILSLINETRKVGGLFVSIWHNTSLIDSPDWQDWRDLFEFMLKNQKP